MFSQVFYAMLAVLSIPTTIFGVVILMSSPRQFTLAEHRAIVWSLSCAVLGGLLSALHLVRPGKPEDILAPCFVAVTFWTSRQVFLVLRERA